MTKRAVAYIDGFNFYNGCVRDQPSLKWLDLRALCETLVRGCEFEAVRYYTAKVFDMPGREGQRRRQEVYLRALGTIDVDIVFGQFKRREKAAALARPLVDGTEIVRIKTNEEKGSDVNLATDLLWDVLTGRGIDIALVISNDFDLQRPIERVMSRGVEVVTVNPHRHRRQRPSLTSSRTVNLRRWHLVNSQLPDKLLDGRGRVITRPHDWA